MAVVKDLTGQRFGRLVAVKCVGRTNNGNAKWLCKCDCGGEKEIASYALRRGQTQSCGCIKREQSKAMFTTHKENSSNSRIYRIWSDMKTRCYNPNQKQLFSYYGERGIFVCEEWRTSYEAFRDWALSNGYDEELTLDRIDYNGEYSPKNCRWATQKQQQNNRRNNHLITFNGETKTIAQWTERLGFGRSVIQHRLARGWSIEKTLTTPMMQSGVNSV